MKIIALVLSIAAGLSSPQAQDEADKAAAELLRKVEEKVMKAKTVRLEFEGTAPGRGGALEKIKGEITLGEKAAFRFSFEFSGGSGMPKFALRSDGVLIAGEGPFGAGEAAKSKPEDLHLFLRRAAIFAPHACAAAVMPATQPAKMAEDVRPMAVTSGGREKVGDVETQAVSYVVTGDFPHRDSFEIKVWIDPERLVIVRRKVTYHKQELEERTTRFEIDGPIPAGTFEFQSEALLKEGLAISLARSVELHARFTGRLPRRLEDLARRPDDLPAAVFWPDGGFWVGGAFPAAIPYAFDDKSFTVGSIRSSLPARSPVAASTDRLKKFYSARVQVQLIRAAAEGYAKAYSKPAGGVQDLFRKPESARFWPEGGWIGGGKAPVDPWGNAYVVRGGGIFTVSVEKPAERALRGSSLTAEERRTLEDIGSPMPTGAERKEIDGLIQALGASSREARESAMAALMAKGPAIVRVVMERLAVEKDPETSARLGMIRDQLRKERPTWESELRPLRATFVASEPGPALMAGYEKFSEIGLKTILAAQEDFRTNDRDGNGVKDYWVRDVAGLLGLEPGTGETEAAPAKEEHRTLRLIEPALAKADTTHGKWDYPTLNLKSPESKAGYYFAALKFYESGEKTEPYHKGSGRNGDKFGFVAYPSQYAFSGRRTLILDNNSRIWSKDLEGEEIDAFPARPELDGWALVE